MKLIKKKSNKKSRVIEDSGIDATPSVYDNDAEEQLNIRDHNDIISDNRTIPTISISALNLSAVQSKTSGQKADDLDDLYEEQQPELKAAPSLNLPDQTYKQSTISHKSFYENVEDLVETTAQLNVTIPEKSMEEPAAEEKIVEEEIVQPLTCGICLNLILDDEYVAFDDITSFHQICFSECCNCKGEVNEEEFIMKKFYIKDGEKKYIEEESEKEEDSILEIDYGDDEEKESIPKDADIFIEVYCDKCALNFSPKCKTCNEPLTSEDEGVIEVGKDLFHKKCFICADCEEPLVEYHAVEDEFICNNCFKPSCMVCKVKISEDKYVTVQINGLSYALHDKCSNCSYCGNTMKAANISDISDRFKCNSCKSKLAGKICVTCHGSITTLNKYLIAGVDSITDKPLYVHDSPNCLKCKKCDEVLTKKTKNFSMISLSILCGDHKVAELY